jgi:P4 family phage/plasmid primase-like protien
MNSTVIDSPPIKTEPQAVAFLQTLFAPGDYVLIRLIETWIEAGRKRSQPDYRATEHRLLGCRNEANKWQHLPQELTAAIERHQQRSEQTRANIFFGVCPRFRPGGANGRYDEAWQIRTVRALWADLDNCTPEEAIERCRAAKLPDPSIGVNSGNGVHLYWLLDCPFLIDDVGPPPPVRTEFLDDGKGGKIVNRYLLDGGDKIYLKKDGRTILANVPTLSAKAQLVQDISKGIAAKIGGDHTTDPTRLLRIPGTLNRKNERNGQAPRQCSMFLIEPQRRYPIDLFAALAEASPDRAHREARAKVKLPEPRKNVPRTQQDRFNELLLLCDTADVGTRSEADFALCCYAIEKGIAKGEVWSQAQSVGKFKEAGERYFERTWAKAEAHTREKIFARATAKAKRPNRGRKGDGPATTGTADDEIHLTDVGNAKRLVAKHGHKLRYVWPWGKWLCWDGRRWRIDDGGHVQRLAKETVLNIYAEVAQAPDDERESLVEHARLSERAAKIAAMIDLSRSEPSIPILPNELDSDAWLLNCRNGTLDLRANKLAPHDPQQMITKLCAAEYDPSATCPQWLRFVGDITAGDEALQAYLQKAVGCSLTGDVREHVLFFLYGIGANGKSTFLNTIQEMMGADYAMKAPPDLLMVKNDSHPTERADLAGKRVVVCIEAAEGRRLAESLVKEMTGGDKVRARRMREDFWEFDPTHKIWLAANHKPSIRGTDEGIWRRIKLIPFTVVIPAGRQDRGLSTKLKAELPGILNWAVQGCLRWQADGLTEPAAVREATGQYRRQQDLLAGFLAECCIVAPDVRAQAATLLATYRKWSGDDRMSQRRLGEMLTERGFDSAKIGGLTWRIGIGLREEE